MDIIKSKDKDYKGYYGSYNPAVVIGFVVSIAVIGAVGYFWGKKEKDNSLLEELNQKTSRLTMLNNRIKMLEFEISELDEGCKTRVEKEIQIENIRQQINQLEVSLSQTTNELNIIQQKK